MSEIVVPTLNTNDESVTLIEWLVKDGDKIQKDDIIAVLETSKATYDLESEASGIIHTTAKTGDECLFGSVIGRLFDTEEARHEFLKSAKASQATCLDDVVITKGAQEIIDKTGITPEQIIGIGKKVIKKSDVANLGDLAQESGDRVNLSKLQKVIARSVRQSNLTIPKSFSAMKIYMDAITPRLKELQKKEKTAVGFPEYLVKIVSDMASDFPFFFGALSNDLSFTPSGDPNIGVTFDMGNGLFIPVVKSARDKSLQEISVVLMDYKMKAFKAGFDTEELSDGHITIALNMDKDLVFTNPIIFPPQTCMLSVGCMQDEVMMADDGKVGKRTFIYMGLAYDHRIINGYQAVQFMKRLKASIETPEMQ